MGNARESARNIAGVENLTVGSIHRSTSFSASQDGSLKDVFLT